jgi:predicted transcriptional regulator
MRARSIPSKKTIKKIISFLLVVTLFLSIFQIFAFKLISAPNESIEPLISSVSPNNGFKTTENQPFHGIDVSIQIKKIFNLDTVFNLRLVLLGRASFENHKIRNENKEIPTNRTIIEKTIEQNPGINLRGIQRVTGLAMGVIQYHLSRLEKDTIESSELGRCKHFFFSPSQLSQKEKLWFSVTRNGNVKSILHFLKLNGNRCLQKDIVNFTGISKVMVSYYVKQLEQHGIINRHHHHIQIVERYLFI